MKQPINEIRRMQQLAGLIKENQASNLENKLKQYHNFLLKLGGGDLAGDYTDMLDKANQYASFEEFVNDDIETLAGEDEEQASEIRQWVDSNL